MTDAGKVCSGPETAAAEAASAAFPEAAAAGEGWGGAVGVRGGGGGDNAGGPAVACTSGWGIAPDKEEGVAAGTDGGKEYTAQQNDISLIPHAGKEHSMQKPSDSHVLS